MINVGCRNDSGSNWKARPSTSLAMNFGAVVLTSIGVTWCGSSGTAATAALITKTPIIETLWSTCIVRVLVRAELERRNLDHERSAIGRVVYCSDHIPPVIKRILPPN